MIKYLSNNEKNNTRIIWEKIFQEDTKKFLDYYYTYKNIDNKILCKYANEKIVSMLHLNPYKLNINNKEFLSYYIVAVATLPEHRKKGYMAQLLNKSLNDMYKENVPFTFLRPAKKEIYLPFDFEYIYNHNYLELNNYNLKQIEINENDYENIANFTNKFLKNKYNTFCIRDYKYIDTLLKEVESENGNIIKLFDNNNFIGYYVYWGLNKKIIRGIFVDEKFINIKETKPLVMARIVNLYEFFKNFSVKGKDTYIYLNIKDNIIIENNGLFKLTILKNMSYIEKVENKNITENILNINIQDLLSLFFGHKNIEDFNTNNFIINNFSNINLLDKVFIDEEV